MQIEEFFLMILFGTLNSSLDRWLFVSFMISDSSFSSCSFPFLLTSIQSVCIFWTIDKRIEIFPSRLIESGNGVTMGSLGTVWHSLTLSAQTRLVTMEPLRRSITSVIRDYHNPHYVSPNLHPSDAVIFRSHTLRGYFIFWKTHIS